MSEGMLIRTIKAKAKRKETLDTTGDLARQEVASKATKVGRASSGIDSTKPTARSPKGVTKKTPAQSTASKAEARRKQAAKVAAAKKKKRVNKLTTKRK